MKPCPHCQHPNPDRAHFCTGCGAELQRQCAACGKNAPADAKFCPNCGAVLLTAPPIPWVERRFSAEVRAALYTLARGVGFTFLALAFITAFLTPPPRVLDETLLLIMGAGLLFVAEFLKGRKPKPPDDDDGNLRRADPDRPPPDGIARDLTDDEQSLADLEELVARRPSLPGSNHGPYLN